MWSLFSNEGEEGLKCFTNFCFEGIDLNQTECLKSARGSFFVSSAIVSRNGSSLNM